MCGDDIDGNFGKDDGGSGRQRRRHEAGTADGGAAKGPGDQDTTTGHVTK